MDARIPPTRTHSGSGPTFTTPLPVLWTCHAISHALSSVHAIALMSCRTTCSKVWQSQLCRIVIQGGASAVSTASRSPTSGTSVSRASRGGIVIGDRVRRGAGSEAALPEGGVAALGDEDLADVGADGVAALIGPDGLDGHDAPVALA